ncbi:MAG: polysaccharide biosynthesis/export family protein [Limnohabitans sp.]|nr:polysaccharide biosynthesis/export family protein [Limnohabitans sp.]
MKKKIYVFSLFSFLFLITSCISNKDLVYLQQKNTSSNQNELNQDFNKPYRVQTSDIISIRIKALDQKLVDMFNPSVSNSQVTSQETLYFDGFTVNDHGIIRVPVLGEVSVIGLTLDEIRLKIEKQLLDDYFKKEADLFVSVKLAGLRYTINGEVTSPGSRILFLDKATILDAISNSGDITMVGNRKEVLIVRKNPAGTEMHTVDLTDVNVMKSPYFYLQPNDFIYVKPLKQKSWGVGTNGIQTFTTLFGAFSLILTTFLLIKK